MGNTSFSSGFATGYGIVSDWKARKEAKAKIDKAAEEMKLADQFDSIAINDNLGKTQNEVYNLVKCFICNKNLIS